MPMALFNKTKYGVLVAPPLAGHFLSPRKHLGGAPYTSLTVSLESLF